MSSPALARLESLLSAHKLDHTLTSRLSPLHEGGQAGLPRGQISEIVGPRSSGRQTILVSCLAAATTRGELAALVDPLDMFDPASAAAYGVELSRMLWVRGCAMGPDRVSLPREAGEAGVQVERAVKALNLILQANGFGLVVLDLGEIPLPVLGRLPFTTWRRLHRVIEGGETACVVVAAAPVARSVGGITVALTSSTTPDVVGLTASGGDASAPEALRRASTKLETFAAERRPGVPDAPIKVRATPLLPRLTIDGRVVHSRGGRAIGIRDSGLGIR